MLNTPDQAGLTMWNEKCSGEEVCDIEEEKFDKIIASLWHFTQEGTHQESKWKPGHENVEIRQHFVNNFRWSKSHFYQDKTR